MEEKKKPIKSALGRGLAALISQPAVSVKMTGNLANKFDNETVLVFESNNIAKDSAPTGKIVPLPTSLMQQVANQLENSQAEGLLMLSPDRLINNPNQPREEFKESEIIELASSINKLGVLQPIVVRPSNLEVGKYEIVAGERRWRASKLAALDLVPVIVKDLSERETLEISIVENVQRENLNPLEQAKAYNRLMLEFNLSHEEVADRVGKDRATVTNIVRILKLNKEVQSLLGEGKITLGHAKALLGIKDGNGQLSLAKKVVNEQLSVRALEALVSRVSVLDDGKARKAKLNSNSTDSDASIAELTERLRRALGTKVQLKGKQSRGMIQIEYFSADELDRLLEKICTEGVNQS